MKHLELSEDKRRTLREMGVFHPHPRTRMRAQVILRLSQGSTLQKTADEFGTVSSSGGNAGTGLAWPGYTRDVTPFD